jgi:hypothetical protein
MRRSLAVAVAVATAARLAAGAARAEIIDATFTTLVQGRQDPRDGALYSTVPLYEQVTLAISEVRLRHFDNIKVVVSGWGQMQLAGDASTEGGTGDLDVGFVEGALFDRRLQLRLGRQIVFTGGARAQPLDGGDAMVRLWRRVSLELWGGVPVTRRFGAHQGDALAGTRLSWRPTVDTELGASFVELVDGGRQARQDLGADARWRPLAWLTLTGYGLLSLLEARLVEGDVAATLQPGRALQLSLDYRRTSPDLFLPRSSILSVFSQQTRDEAGGFVFWRPLLRLTVDGDWHAIVDGAGFGQRGGGRVAVSLGPAFETRVAAELRALRLATANGYTQARLYVVQRLATRWTATLDLDGYRIEQPINGTRFSLTAAATLGWRISAHLDAVVTAIADSTPLVERRFECMAKLVWNQTFRLREVRP